MSEELKVKDIASEGVIAIDKNATVSEASKKMRDQNIRSLVVVSGDEAVGIIVDRDITYNVVAEGEDASQLEVEEVMTSELVTASEEDVVEDVAKAMTNNNISRLPVLRGDKVVGIITRKDIIKAWPAYINLITERAQLNHSNEPVRPQIHAGICDSCGNYSNELKLKNGRWHCENCR